MKRILLSLSIALASFTAFAQSGETPVQNISTDSSVTYRLFATKNMYTFIKLDTRNGRMWQVQWGTDSKYRFTSIITETPKVEDGEEKIGRFFLYPTANIYSFILLDQVDGRTWQVQWSQKEDERLVIPIY